MRIFIVRTFVQLCEMALTNEKIIEHAAQGFWGLNNLFYLTWIEFTDTNNITIKCYEK